jgi:hypothetical protein
MIAVKALNAREELLAKLQDLRVEHAHLDPQLHQVGLVARRLYLRAVLSSTTRQCLTTNPHVTALTQFRHWHGEVC